MTERATDGAGNGQETDGFGIKADTDDARPAEIAAKLTLE